MTLIRGALIFIIILFGREAKAQVFEEYLLSGWTLQSASNSSVLPAEVPGSVQYNLTLNGRKRSDTLDDRWTYAVTFQADRHILSRTFINLLFEGLDSHAEVYLNNQLILRADNMFRTWSVPVKSFLKGGENQLRIEFLQTAADSLQIRKARYHFDRPLPEVPLGIWKPVILQSYDTFYFSDFSLVQDSVTGRTAHLHALVEIRGQEGTGLSVEVFDEISAKVYARESITLPDSSQIHRIPFKIQRADLWWPADLGEQAFYQIGVRISGGKSDEQKRVKRTGIRQLMLDEGLVKVNGKVLDVKATDYVPRVLEVSAMRSADYDHLFDSLVREGINLIHVMGTGLYESDYFYDLADSRGILIVQDFMFAGGLHYPANDAFMINAGAEITQEIKRLSHHPSLIAWRATGLEDSSAELLDLIRELAVKNEAILMNQDGSNH